MQIFFILQEILLDYGFAHLGLNEYNKKKCTQNMMGSVPHPVVMTEPFGNPNSCRGGKFVVEVES